MLTPILYMQQQKSSNPWEMMRSVLFMILVQILTNFAAVRQHVIEFIENRNTQKQHKKTKSLCVIAHLMYENNFNTGGEIPSKFTAISQLITSLVTSDDTDYEDASIKDILLGNGRSTLYVLSSKPIYLNETIFATTSEFIQKCSENIKEVSLTIEISSTDNSFKTINDFIQKETDAYLLNELTNLKTPCIFILDVMHERMISYKEIKFETTKSFDNLFFEDKDELMRSLNYFENNRERYEHLGMPYSFGMMFHGPPGCGKTSCIKAIARFTGRHIISIPLNKIKTAQHLKDVFMKDHINNVIMPNDKRLYVFEEIDCGNWGDIVTSRKLLESQQQATNTDENMMIKMKMSEPELTLADLLEILDGIVEMPGRMIIMTSNHPEKLDEALLRPGRIDKVIEFKKMTRKDIDKMYHLWFDKHIPTEVYEEVKDYKFSQADIGNLFTSGCMTHIHNALRRL